jgi:hypothetical protein
MRKRYSDANKEDIRALVLFNHIQSPEKSESMYKLSQKSEVVRTANRAVKVFEEEDHLFGCNDTIRSPYKELRESSNSDCFACNWVSTSYFCARNAKLDLQLSAIHNRPDFHSSQIFIQKMQIVPRGLKY